MSRINTSIIAGMLLLGMQAAIVHAEDAPSVEQALAAPPAARLAKPTPQQYAWHEQERLMFVCLDPCTWQGREYDNHSTPLSAINPALLDANQFCQVAKSWGAKQILLVAKHTGGFCWWQTDTSDYSVRKTPWRGGKGDLVQEVADACRQHGLNLGIYVSPRDDQWGAADGGRTKDPAQQEVYNKIYRQQWTELLTRYGKITEVWFDGSCVIEVGDILQRHAPEAIVFQGPHASIRWPGNESGKLPYPVWSSLKRRDLVTGSSTARHDDPDGDAWATHEADTPLYNHYWFWSAANEAKRKSLAELISIYSQSVGRGGVLLLNSTPNTDGRIPDGDVELYKAFGKELDRCFGLPVAETNGTGKTLELDLGQTEVIDWAMIMEDYRQGHRIREYVLEGLSGDTWQRLASGSSVGRMKLDGFTETRVRKIRLRVTRCADEPLIRRLAVFRNGLPATIQPLAKDWRKCDEWTPGSTYWNGELKEKIPGRAVNLDFFIRAPGEYEVRFEPTAGTLSITNATLLLDGTAAIPGMLTKTGADTYLVVRTGQVTSETRTCLRVGFAGRESAGTVWVRSRL
jgi:alpha-L-fucosidase